jgi:hypothetical protein
VKEGAFEPIVLPSTFEKAQQVLNQRVCRKSNEDILVDLRKILVREGRLSGTLLTNTRGAPSKTACMRRFGSLKTAFELAKSLEDQIPAFH